MWNAICPSFFEGGHKYTVDGIIFVGTSGYHIFLHKSYRKLLFHWYWNSWIGPAMKFGTHENFSRSQYPSQTRFHALKDVSPSQRFEPTCMLTILKFYNAYIISLSNHTKNENISFHQESYVTKHYFWVNCLSPPFCAKFSCTKSSVWFPLLIGHCWVLQL